MHTRVVRENCMTTTSCHRKWDRKSRHCHAMPGIPLIWCLSSFISAFNSDWSTSVVGDKVNLHVMPGACAMPHIRVGKHCTGLVWSTTIQISLPNEWYVVIWPGAWCGNQAWMGKGEGQPTSHTAVEKGWGRPAGGMHGRARHLKVASFSTCDVCS